jgi:iron complex transport system substrate-binding protein
MNNQSVAKRISLSRRKFLIGAGSAAGASLLAACAAPAAAPTAAPQNTAAPAPTEAPPAATTGGAFPVTLKHKFGETVVTAEPKRVIALGYSEVDPILALGVVPVALREWFGDQPNGVWPWSQGALNGQTPELLKMEFGQINLETIAALKPDLIIATHSGITDKEYASLAAIAPTLAQPGDYPDFGVPWQEQTRLIGKALGKSAQAGALVQATEDKIAATRTATGSIEGKTVTWASPADEAATFWATGPTTPPMRFLAAIGMRFPEELGKLIGDKSSEKLSAERLDLLDADVLISYVQTDEARVKLQSDPVLQSLNVVKDGRWIIFVGDDANYGALSYSTAPSLAFAAEKLVPLLAEAASKSKSKALPDAAPKPADGVFPVTLKHKFGETTVVAEPKRVIALGYSDQDPILALGVKPIATRYWWGDEQMAAFPWAQDELGDAKPEVLKMQELNFEKLAALKPDLIVATYAGIKAEEFETLSKIAPTVAQSGEYLDYGMPWQETTLMIGKALGREAQAQTLVADIEQRFAALREKYPAWAGKSVIIGSPFEGKFGFMASQDPRSRMFASLGFKVPDAFDKIADGSFYGTVSSERIDLLNTDLIVFHQLQWVKGGRAAIESDALLTRTEPLKEKRVIFLEGELDDAFQFNSVLSLPQVLDKVAPMIAVALGSK